MAAPVCKSFSPRGALSRNKVITVFCDIGAAFPLKQSQTFEDAFVYRKIRHRDPPCHSDEVLLWHGPDMAIRRRYGESFRPATLGSRSSPLCRTCRALRGRADVARMGRAGQSKTAAPCWAAVKFIKGGPDLPPPLQLTELKSWTEQEAPAYKSFSGTATYSMSIFSVAL